MPPDKPLPQTERREVTLPTPSPVLRFTPTAWAKLQWFCHKGDTEIGGFGICPPDDLLLVEDFLTVKQRVTMVSVAFDDSSVADFFDQQVDLGRKPRQFSRIWLHSHPGNSPRPSGTDEETFQRVFGHCDWAILFVVAQDGKTYARLRFNVGPGGQMVIPVQIDYGVAFPGADHAAWELEYWANIVPEPPLPTGGFAGLEAATAVDDLRLMEGPDLDLFDEQDFQDWVEDRHSGAVGAPISNHEKWL